MENSTVIQEIVERLEKLTPGQQKQVLDFALELSGELPEGTPELLKFTGTIPPEDLEIMKQAIKENCGKIDASEW